MNEKIKSLGGILIYILYTIAALTLIIMFFKNIQWFTEYIYHPMLTISELLLLVIIFILLPLSFIKALRKYNGYFIFILSYYFGLILWFTGVIEAYNNFGIIGLIIGLFFIGIGVVPIAMIGDLIHGLWSMLLNFIILIAVTYGCRAFGTYLIEKSEEYFDEFKTKESYF